MKFIVSGRRVRPGGYSVMLLPFTMKSGGLSSILTRSMGRERRFATEGFLVSLVHLDPALQANCEWGLDVAKGGNGIVTAQPASMIIAAAAAANFKMLGPTGASMSEISM